MKYYHYGNKNMVGLMNIKKDEEVLFKYSSIDLDDTKNTHNGSLIIEDDTVYEIDEECIRCRK